TTWGCMAYWLPISYPWGNFTILALGVWAVAQRDSIDAILMFLTGLLLTILTDIIHFSLYYPQSSSLPDTTRFSAGMAIFSLLLKPLSCFFAYQMYRERGGEYAFNLVVHPFLPLFDFFSLADWEASSERYSAQDGIDSTALSLICHY
uniref:Angiotensin II receptor associated protein n=1 Tax=Podarcis muralis TaxID=64176 RepID=A0A670JLV0_PODMU